MLKLWEIFVPTHHPSGPKIGEVYHEMWDQYVSELAGGLTIYSPLKGRWQDNGTMIKEGMIPCRIVCEEGQIELIAQMTAKHYQQKEILYWKVSDEVYLYQHG